MPVLYWSNRSLNKISEQDLKLDPYKTLEKGEMARKCIAVNDIIPRCFLQDILVINYCCVRSIWISDLLVFYHGYKMLSFR